MSATKTNDKDSAKAEKEDERQALMAQVVEMREKDPQPTWEDIAEETGIAANRVMFLYMQAKVRPKDRIKGKTDEELGAAIVVARDEDLLSWGQIMARSSLGEAKCRSLYVKATGKTTKGNRIGKGGRWPAGQDSPKDEKPAPKAKAKATPKKAAKKAPAKKAASKAKGNKWVGKTYEEMSDGMDGKTVTYKVKGKQHRIKVEAVADLTGEGADAELSLESADGESTVITVGSVVRVASR